MLSGEGRGFCAGLDVATLGAIATIGDDDRSGDGQAGRRARHGRPACRASGPATPGGITNVAQQAVYTWTELPVPVIAAVHGVALGGGIQIALGADLRIVAPDARLSVLEIRWGILPDMTGLQTLPRLVGLDVAKELAFTGRMVSGEEAVALGLATRVSERPARRRVGPGPRDRRQEPGGHPWHQDPARGGRHPTATASRSSRSRASWAS